MNSIINKLAVSVRNGLLLACCQTGLAENLSTPADIPMSIDVCMTCHGAFGQGSPVVGGPSLAGLEPWYLRRQLQSFRAGYRGMERDYIPAFEMRRTAEALSDEDIEEIVSMVSAWPAAASTHTVQGNAAAGESLYQTCAACHGLQAQGNEALGAPALSGRNDWYLLRQLKLFKSGYRGSHPDDSYGSQMRSMTGQLGSEQDMLDVISYIGSLD